MSATTTHRNGTNGRAKRETLEFPATIVPTPTDSIFEPADRPGPRQTPQDAVQAVFDRLARPFLESEIKTRRGPRGDLRYITKRTVIRRLNEVLGPANWSVRIEPSERWVKGGDSDSMKRAAVLFGIDCAAEDDEPAPAPAPRPAPASRPTPAPRPTAPAVGYDEPTSARRFYGELKDSGLIEETMDIGRRENWPARILAWSPDMVEQARAELEAGPAY